MTDEERRDVIMREAFDNLDRLADFKVEHRDVLDLAADDLARRDQPSPASAPPAPEVVLTTRAATDLNARRTRDWEQWCDARIATAIKKNNRFWRDVFGQAIAIQAKRFEEKLGQLRADMTIQKAHGNSEHHDSVVDVPKFLTRRRSEAA